MDIRIKYSRTIQVNEFEPATLEMETVVSQDVVAVTRDKLIKSVDSTLEQHVEVLRNKCVKEAGVTYFEED